MWRMNLLSFKVEGQWSISDKWSCTGIRCLALPLFLFDMNLTSTLDKRKKNYNNNKGYISCIRVQFPFWRIGQGGHFVLWSTRKTNLVEDIEILLPVNFRWIPFSGCRGKAENVSANQRPGGNLGFPIGPKNTNLVEDVEILLSVKFSWFPFSGFRGEINQSTESADFDKLDG